MLSDQVKKVMDQVIDWKSEIGAIAGPFLPHDTKLSWLARAARKCGITLRHVQSIYYGRVKDPKFSVASNILSAADKARIEEARRNVEMVTRFVRQHAEGLKAVDADLYRDQIDELVREAGRLGSRDSA
jgi:hypothetical protein